MPSYLSIPELKLHLNKTSAADDAEAVLFADAAEAMVQARIGWVAPTPFVEDRVGGYGDADWLANTPVVSVTSVQVLPSLAFLPAENIATGVAGWSVTPDGLLRYGRRVSGGVRVSYVAGRQPIPAHVRLATLELAAHLWRSTQNARAPRNATPDVPRDAPFGFAMPNRVQEMLEPEYRHPVIVA